MTISLKEQIIARAWEDETFKAQLLADPKSTIKNTFGIDIPEGVDLEALNESSKKFYLVIPPKPSELSSDEPVALRWI